MKLPSPLFLAGLLALFGAVPCVKGEYPVERPARKSPAAAEGDYTVRTDRPRQVFNGFGFEIQADSICSGNQGLPEEMVSVPHDLTPGERQRFCREMLAGFRYCRLAGGLFWRGLDAEGKTFRGRWPGQMAELSEMIRCAGVEGVSLEYWSPAPFWKSTGKLVGKQGGPNVLRCFGKDFANDPVYHGNTERFLKDFAEANRHDLQTLRDAGIPVSFWGLQNEPPVDETYSSCKYQNPQDYARVFNAVAPVVRAFDPKIRIIADSWDLKFIGPVLADPEKARLVDALVVHHVGSDANVVRGDPGEPFGKPSFQNEYEYLGGPASPARCMNTALHVMNWLQLGRAPTWFWIHALKPFKNKEASGYSLGFWRPLADVDAAHEYPGIQPGHWVWNPYNWNAVGSFVRHMPWDCRVVEVSEGHFDNDLRLLAFIRPNGKLTVVVANRSFSAHTFHLKTGCDGAAFEGWRYTPEAAGEDCRGVAIGTLTAGPNGTISPKVNDMSWEFWEQW